MAAEVRHLPGDPRLDTRPMVRVDQAGEYGAARIYAGQLAVMGDRARVAGEIDAPLSKQPGTGGEKMHVDPEAGLKAKTRYRVLDYAAGRAAWVEFMPLTGRTHQIRVHAAAIGHAIVGDGKYGGKEAFLTGGISRKLHLHARRLVIDAPDGGKIDITADVPTHISESFSLLGFDPALGTPLVEVPKSATPKPKSRRMSSATSGNRRGERRSRGS